MIAPNFPTWTTEDGRATIHHGDCLDVMRGMAAGSVDAVVTDPPYGLAFMGKSWDHGVPGEAFWIEAARVAKPGAHLLAFGGTRTFHRLACAIEDAGWEIRDCLMWIYAQGFPKSARVNLDPKFCQCGETARSGECIDLARTTDDRTGTDRPSSDDGLLSEGGPRSTRTAPDSRGGCRLACDSDDAQPLLFGEAVRVSPPSREDAQERSRSAAPSDGPANAQERTPSPARRSDLHASTDSPPRVALSDEPPDTQDGRTSRADMSGTGDRKRGTQDDSSCADYAPGFPRCQVCGKPNADGWGTALKPAYEPVILARKPLAGTVAANVEKHGTGALNIDGCRIGTDEIVTTTGRGFASDGFRGGVNDNGGAKHVGRWPANVALDDEAARLLDEQSGAVGGAGGDTSGPNALGQSSGWNAHTNRATEIDRIKDSGGASRFFYTAKASRSEREAGLREAGLREAEIGTLQGGGPGANDPVSERFTKIARNTHPTVKPVDLMRWLVRLVTPLGGTVLDPFLGSGTTLVAALQEGCKGIGIEREAPYVEIAKARVAHEAAQGRLFA